MSRNDTPTGTKWLTTERCEFCGAQDVWSEGDELRCEACGRRERPINDLMAQERRRGKPEGRG